jgi:hypothetical protein
MQCIRRSKHAAAARVHMTALSLVPHSRSVRLHQLRAAAHTKNLGGMLVSYY